MLSLSLAGPYTGGVAIQGLENVRRARNRELIERWGISDVMRYHKHVRTYGTSSYALAKLGRLIRRGPACLKGHQHDNAKCGE